ncbi:putative Peroxidase 48 [Ananas comosus]|uniref:Putative Peroxidase 48 n=1 Tax=Ananas comosus TaxID=4615 RepID=A0A199VPP9_ANACO|nr:putative Peroxidase 48 [Ananas comosus]
MRGLCDEYGEEYITGKQCKNSSLHMLTAQKKAEMSAGSEAAKEEGWEPQQVGGNVYKARSIKESEARPYRIRSGAIMEELHACIQKPLREVKDSTQEKEYVAVLLGVNKKCFEIQQISDRQEVEFATMLRQQERSQDLQKKNTKKKKKKKKKKRMSGVLRWGATLLAVSLLLSLIELGGEGTKKPSNIPPLSDLDDRRIADKPRQLQDDEGEPSTSFSFSSSAPSPQYLEVGFYRRKCPRAEGIVESTVNDLYSRNSSVAPALLRLLFHDCFIHVRNTCSDGCDGSVLLDRINGSLSERDAIPNRTLRGFDAVDAIKSAVEAVCPATVSCADILALAARDGLKLVGGPSYTVFTGRRDSVRSFYDEAQIQIPTPNDTYAKTLSSFASRGFTERETVALLGFPFPPPPPLPPPSRSKTPSLSCFFFDSETLIPLLSIAAGAHSIGKVHCRFFRDRLYDFAGTGEPDGSLDREMVEEMRAICGGDAAAAAAEEAGMEMGYCREGREVGFGSHYYWRLLEGRGILRADQQLTAGRTVRWVRAYAAGWEGERAFRADFAGAMVKLSALGPPLASQGQVRTRCSRILGS